MDFSPVYKCLYIFTVVVSIERLSVCNFLTMEGSSCSVKLIFITNIILYLLFREKEKPLITTTGNKEENKLGLQWNSLMELE